jgi:hypothetical protein
MLERCSELRSMKRVLRLPCQHLCIQKFHSIRPGRHKKASRQCATKRLYVALEGSNLQSERLVVIVTHDRFRLVTRRHSGCSSTPDALFATTFSFLHRVFRLPTILCVFYYLDLLFSRSGMKNGCSSQAFHFGYF